MSSEDATSHADQPAGPESSPDRLLHGRFAAVLCIVAILGIIALQATAPWTDHQIANLLTGVLIVVALLAGYLTWLLSLRPTLIGAVMPPILLGLFLVGFGMLFRYKGVSGEMVPIFTYRHADPPEYAGLDGESAAAVVLEVDPESDYPQFLGPNRTGFITQRQFGLGIDAGGPPLLWRQPIGGGWSGFATAGPYAVTMEQRGHLREEQEEEEWVACYRMADGSLVWKQSWPALHTQALGGLGPRSTPTIHDGRVYVQGATGHLACLDGSDGSILWQHDLLQLAGLDQDSSEEGVLWGRAASPLVYGDTVVVPLGGPAEQRHSLIAFDRLTGEEQWRGGDSQVAYASPVLETVAGVEQILSVNEDNIASYDPETGQQLWRFPWPGSSNAAANCSQPVVVDADSVLVSKGYGGGAMLLRLSRGDDGWKAEPVWKNSSVLKTKFTSAIYAGGHLYGLSDGSLQCVDPRTGDELWKQPRRGRYGHGQVIVVEDVILVQAEDGDVAIVAANPNAFEEIVRFPALEGKTWNYPAIAGRHLLVRNADQAVCFELPLP